MMKIYENLLRFGFFQHLIKVKFITYGCFVEQVHLQIKEKLTYTYTEASLP